MNGWLTEDGPAKINLALHVIGQAADGRHLLSSLVGFTEIGDTLFARHADQLSLDIQGEHGTALTRADDNLILRAAKAFGLNQGAEIRLEKCLPIAAGIGGGSADAAAALRLLGRLWQRPLPEALPLGADVPVCLTARPTLMEGIGEHLTHLQALPVSYVVLVNPGVKLSTAEVFQALDTKNHPPLPTLPSKWADSAALAIWLRETRNDLERPAISIVPEIGEVLAALQSSPGCMLARMSGSGATCFGLFQSAHDAQASAKSLARARPHWWVRPTQLQH